MADGLTSSSDAALKLVYTMKDQSKRRERVENHEKESICRVIPS